MYLISLNNPFFYVPAVIIVSSVAYVFFMWLNKWSKEDEEIMNRKEPDYDVTEDFYN